MTATTEPRGGLDLGWTPGEDGWGPAMNANLLRISRLGFHASALSMTTAAPPGSPTSGAGYIIPSGASGAWAGRAGQVAVWDGSAWAYAVPRDGWTIHVVGTGLVTYEDGAWSQANAVKPAEIGAEPYAGVPAQTSFWRSTAAGVRAWTQLVAADITDLATTLAAYLTKANPTFTGTLSGPTVNATTSILVGGATAIDASRNITGATIKGGNLVGAGDRPVAADLTGTLQPKTPDQFRNMIFALASSLKGAANGVAELGADGRVPSGQLPSYVDDVLEYATFSAFPDPGEAGKIYINLDQNRTWRWSGSGYAEISASLALGETWGTAYRGDRGKTAYDHSQVATGNPHGTTAADVGAMASTNPDFTGALKQGGATRITSGGGADFASLRVSNLSSAFNGVLTSDYVGGVGVRGAADFRDNYIQAAASDHSHFSKLDVSASTTLGAIDASAIKVTTTDVILTLSGGVDGQGWDVINPTASTGIAIPSGATLWKSIGSNVGPTTIALGGGRPIRITRIDANTWTMLGSQ